MKNNLSYYSHDVNSHNHWKFKTLRRKYKWCGEGKFWALNNMIAEADGCRLDIKDFDKKASIAADLDFDIPEFDQFIDYLIKVCKLIIEEDGHLLTEKTQENLEGVNDKRERQRNWKKQKSTPESEKSTSTNEQSTVENEQSKLKESKEKESKLKNIPTGGVPAKPSTPKKVGNKGKGKTEPYWQELVSTWFDFHKKNKLDDPSFEGKDPRLFQQLINLLKKRAARKKNEWTGEHACGSLNYFLALAFKEEWLSKHFLLENLVKQFDAVYQRSLLEKQKKENLPPASSTAVPKTFNEEIRYLIGRYQEKQLDETLINPEYYDKLQVQGFMPSGTIDRQPGATIDDKKRAAVLEFIKTNAHAKVE